MTTIVLIIVLLLLFGGGGWGYRSGRFAVGDPSFIILLVLIVLVLFGGIVGPGLGLYHY